LQERGGHVAPEIKVVSIALRFKKYDVDPFKSEAENGFNEIDVLHLYHIVIYYFCWSEVVPVIHAALFV
jgi:hypothetical protein